MLYSAPQSTSARVLGWVRRALHRRPPHPVTDIRELNPHLRADIGASDFNAPFRR